MMKQLLQKLTALTLLSLLMLASRGLAGQPGAKSDTLMPANLQVFVDLALQSNPAIKSAEKRYRALQAVPRQVSSLPDPMLGYTRWARSVETRVGPQENVFVLSQRVPFPGKLGLKARIATQDANAAYQDFEATKRDIVFKVKSTYADLYLVDRSLQILATYKALLKDFAQVASTKYATGKGIQAQVLKAQVEISAISVKQLAFEKRRTGVAARLNALMDRPAGAPIGQALQLALPDVPKNKQNLIARAYANRQELLATQAMIDKAAFAKKLAHKNYWPDFNIQAMYITVPKVNNMFTDSGKDAFSLMAGINLPIWLGKRKAAVEQASETQAAQRLKFENLRNSIEAEITDLLFQINTLNETLNLYRDGLLIQAESSLQSAVSAYKTGRLDFLNLLDAERMLLQLRLAYTREQANYFKKYAALERAIGGKFETQ